MLEQTGEQDWPVGDGRPFLEFFDLAEREATRTERSRRVPCRHRDRVAEPRMLGVSFGTQNLNAD